MFKYVLALCAMLIVPSFAYAETNRKHFDDVMVEYGLHDDGVKRANPYFCDIKDYGVGGGGLAAARQFCLNYTSSFKKAPCPAGEQCPLDVGGKAYRLIKP